MIFSVSFFKIENDILIKYIVGKNYYLQIYFYVSVLSRHLNLFIFVLSVKLSEYSAW